MLRHEEQAWQENHHPVAGVDEAGRGPIAGPVVAAAVIFDRQQLQNGIPPGLRGLTDSKQLTAKQRDHHYNLLTAELPYVRFGIGIATAEEIDRLNILRATHLAMARAIRDLDPPREGERCYKSGGQASRTAGVVVRLCPVRLFDILAAA